MPSLIPLQGKRVGRLLVIEIKERIRTSKGQSAIIYSCLCDCGNKIDVRSTALSHRKRPTQSCGCLQKDTAKRIGALNQKGEGVSATYNLFRICRTGAKKRGFTFSLTQEQFVSFLSEPCYYCGALKYSTYKNKYSYNGIDRIDNKKGYELGNIVTCCYRCNRSKNSMPQDIFLDMCKKIYERHFT